ncbi:hypothetical protein [Streptomyces sp. NPDC054958]
MSNGAVISYAADGTVTGTATLEPQAFRPWERTEAQQRASDLALCRMSPEPVVGEDGATYTPLGAR